MRKKELQIVITFNTTTDAMAYEKYCKEHNINGRIIPIPVSITATCGLAFLAPVSDKNIHYEMELNIDEIYEIIV